MMCGSISVHMICLLYDEWINNSPYGLYITCVDQYQSIWTVCYMAVYRSISVHMVCLLHVWINISPYGLSIICVDQYQSIWSVYYMMVGRSISVYLVSLIKLTFIGPLCLVSHRSVILTDPLWTKRHSVAQNWHLNHAIMAYKSSNAWYFKS